MVAALDFHAAYTRVAEATKLARRLSDVGWRWNERYRLWEHPGDPGIAERSERLHERRHAAIDEAEDAAPELDDVWDRLSRALPRRTDLHALNYTERTFEEQCSGYRPMASNMMGLIEHYARPPLNGWGLDYGYRQHIKKGVIR